MEKHVFQLVSLGSSNTTIPSTRNENWMKKKAIILLMAILAASMLVGTSLAQPTVDPPVVQPGDSFTITGQTNAETNVVIIISNTRAQIDAFNITSDQSGLYTTQYQLSKDAAIDIYTINVTIDGETVESSIIVSKMSQQQLVNTIGTLVLNTRKQAETMIIQARKEGKLTSEALELYQHGKTSLENAVNSIENQDYTQAHSDLQEAMNRFKEVIEYNYGAEVEAPVESDEAYNLVREKIDQLNQQYRQINATVQKLNENGLNTDVLTRDLKILRTRLNEAESLLEAGDLAEAEKIVDETHNQVSQRLEQIQQRQTEVTKRLAERYQTSLENRVEVYIDTFRKLQTIRPVQSVQALQELEQLQTKLNDSNTQLESGNVLDAVRELRATETRLKRLSNAVNGPVTSRLLNRIDELTASIERGNEAEIRNEIETTKNTLKDYLRSKNTVSGSTGGVFNKP